MDISTVETILTEVRRQTQAEEVRAEIHKMRDLYGACLNHWPQPCRAEYERLAHLLRRLESDGAA